MANQKKGFVMYFDSLGLLSLFPPSQIGELLLALYDYAYRICETEESPETALLRYPTLDGTTQVGFCSIAGHILRDTRKWKQRQQHCQQSALERHRKAREETALQQTAPPPRGEEPRNPPPQQKDSFGDFRQARQPEPPARAASYSQRRQDPPARSSRYQQQGIPADEMARYVHAFRDPSRRPRREQNEEDESDRSYRSI